MKQFIVWLLVLGTFRSYADMCGKEQCFSTDLKNVFKYEWQDTILKDEINYKFKMKVNKFYKWMEYSCVEAMLSDKYFLKSIYRDIPEENNKFISKEIEETYPISVMTTFKLVKEGDGINIDYKREVTSPVYFPVNINIFDAGTLNKEFTVTNYSSSVDYKIGAKFLPLERLGRNKVIDSTAGKMFTFGQKLSYFSMHESDYEFDLGEVRASDSFYFYIDAPVEGFEYNSRCSNYRGIKPYPVAEETIYFGKNRALGNAIGTFSSLRPIFTKGSAQDVEYYLNYNQTKLFLKLDGEIIAKFSRANQISESGFSISLKDEVNILNDNLQFAKKRMRRSVYNKTYADIEQAVNKLKISVDKGANALYDSVKQEFEVAYFLAKKIVVKDIEKDLIVGSYGKAIKIFVEHLEYLNKEFFQFNPEEPGVKIIKLTAQSIQHSSQKALQVISSDVSAGDVKYATSVLETFIDMTEDLIVMDPLGSLNEETLNNLYKLLDYYELHFKEVERTLIDFNVDSELSQIKSVFDLLMKVTE